MKYLLYNGKTVTGEGVTEAAVLIEGEKIAEITPSDKLDEDFLSHYADARAIDLKGGFIFAGGIDAHVHFREPGMTHKADIGTESKAAVKGGITSFIDMPNTKPATVSAGTLAEKLALAEGRAFANYGFHLGATNGNFQEITEILESGKDGISKKDFGGIKVFMGSSTGNMLVDDEDTLRKIFGIKEKEILVHCEDEQTIRENLKAAEERFGEDIPFGMHPEIRSRRACILSSIKALETAIALGTRLHLLHISTKEEAEMVRAAKLSDDNITAETSVNYLWFCDDDYERLGARMKCNPAIKSADDRKALRQALKDGIIDTIGSDHAPHLAEEKDRKYPVCPSGVPSIQHSLPVLLTIAAEEDIPLTRIASVLSEKTAEMFGIEGRGVLKEGYYADLVVVDMDSFQTVSSKDPDCKCGWSPYEGERLKGRITDVFVNGHHVIGNSEFISEIPCGQKLIFGK